jgi:hypothetical protein
MTMPVAPSAARIPPDPALPPHQRDWHEHFRYQDHVELAADLAAVPAARLLLRADLREWGLDTLTHDAELVAAEIVANAVNTTQAIRWPASRPPVRLWIRGDIGMLVILAWDATSQAPQLSSPDIWDETGRGLLLIDAYSRWGYYHPPGDGAGKVIWAQCALEAPDCIPGSAGRNLEDIPGSMAYLESKGKGDRSMPLKRWPGPGIRDGVPQDPRNMSES